MKRLSEEDVRRDIAALDTMDAPTLRERWREVYAARIREVLLRRGITYQLQVMAFGGLKPATVRHLTKLAKELRSERGAANGGRVSVTRQLPKPLPEAQLLREWRGSTEIVAVTSEGFAWKGKAYRTLSAVATAITGTKWSGPKFFGLLDRNPSQRATPNMLKGQRS
jgi:DUF2924 family protein